MMSCLAMANMRTSITEPRVCLHNILTNSIPMIRLNVVPKNWLNSSEENGE